MEKLFSDGKSLVSVVEGKDIKTIVEMSPG
jgi:hypothetical protein